MIKQIWQTGNSLVITIDKDTQKYYNLKKGDRIDVRIIKKK